MPKPIKKSLNTSWLTELQQKSWEPEILLSGIVLYGLFQIPAILDALLLYGKDNLFGDTTDLDNLISSLKVALYWLTCGLILHLISRGIWVGMVGLSFTFPNGMNKERLKVTGKFEQQLDKIPSIEQIIINLEKVSSALFSVSFMLFMIMMGAYLFILILLVIPIFGVEQLLGIDAFGKTAENVISIYAVTILSIGGLSLVDFVTLGFFRRFKWVSKLYYPLYWLVSSITLSRFYRPIYYTIISNYGKWKIGLFLIFFAVTSVFGVGGLQDGVFPGESLTQLEFWNNSRRSTSFSGHYDDQIDDFHSVQAQIQSDIISGNTLRLFVVLKVSREDSIRKYCNYDSLISQTKMISSEIEHHCASAFYHVYLNDSLISDQKWLFKYKQRTEQRGLISYIDVSDLPQGMHSIRVRGPKEMYKFNFSEIPFYREISQNEYYVPQKPKKKE
ncbi:MAG: hypothetical protein RIA69_03395 [Cyclobacteriaceae bacterium]